MELKLLDGQYVTGENKAPVTIDGTKELAQRIALKLRVRRGAFLPLPEFGSRLYLLGRVRPSERETAARQYVREALADEEGLSVDSLTLCAGAEGDALLRLSLSLGGAETLNVETGI